MKSNGAGVSFRAVAPASRRCANKCAVASGEIDYFEMNMVIQAAAITVTAEEMPIMGSASERIGGAAAETMAVVLIVGGVPSEAGADTAVEITDTASNELG